MPTECGPRTEKFFFRSQSFNQQQLTDLVTFVFSLPLPPESLPTRQWTSSLRLRSAARQSSSAPNQSTASRFLKATSVLSATAGPSTRIDSQLDVGSGKATDRSPLVDVPQLPNVAYSAPYLHDGSARSLEEIWTVFNPHDTHGVTNDLTKDELNDLIEYLKTL